MRLSEGHVFAFSQLADVIGQGHSITDLKGSRQNIHLVLGMTK